MKNAPDEELLLAIRTIHGVGLISILKWLLLSFVSSSKRYDVTIRRSYEICQAGTGDSTSGRKGYGNKEVAEKLFISVKTVEANKAKIMEKLNLRSRPELVQYALKKKMLDF